MPCRSDSQPSPRRLRHVAALALAAVLAGCSSYSAKPLAEAPAFPAALPAVPATDSFVFNASDGLDVQEVAVLALAQNPDLRLARNARRLTQAQSFAAGLLPDPAFNFSRDFPDATGPGISSAFLLGIGYSVNALLTRPATLEAGRQDLQQARLALLWQEWQTIAQARLLYVRLQAAEAKRALLETQRATLEARYGRARQALDQGLLTLDVLTPDLAALQDLTRQLADLRRLSSQGRLDLDALLGLAPGTALPLQGSADFAAIDPTAIRAALPRLVAGRPDIQALRAGYAAQDARYRIALLNQFPALTLGVQRARDTSNTYTSGFGINLALPLLNGNRGEVRVQDATRDKLRAEYQQRLNTGSFDIERLLADQALTQRQIAELEPALATLRATRERMRSAYAARYIDAAALASLETATLAKEIELLDARQALQEQRVGLLALTGGPRFSPLLPTETDLPPP
ncbi:TolC family protein [Xylophilus rhododendri]|uniref:TolC family protein n=1 Tax=Xylophilus rhododendri TaxID=2697032 RepID=A0A857J9E2_9BURK|nr:TolC family protein [Xylophilus rhododendri]QHJ00348.1 TolC family protein [Xylophilus rhododendri]